MKVKEGVLKKRMRMCIYNWDEKVKTKEESPVGWVGVFGSP